MADVFESIVGQPKVRAFLRATVDSGHITHAYLFTGQAGSNKTSAAYAFAQAIICEKRGCGQCDDCRRIIRRKHPDVRYFAPEGPAGYAIEQIRDITADCALAPIRAKRKVYILDRVDLLGVKSANAFLKTLEEPQDDVVLILMGRTRESVLPTIVSRCQVVPFRQIPAKEAVGIVVQNTGASPEKAAAAIQACGGSITKGTEFVRSAERMAFRARVIQVLELLETGDDLDILGYAAELLTKAKAPLDIVRAEQEKELAENADFLASSAIRRIEKRNKSAITMKTLEYLRQTMAIIRSWLRDVLMACSGTPELIINRDVRVGIEQVAARTNAAAAARAVEAVGKAEDAIAYNVSPETCIDVLLFDIREALYDTRSTH